MTPQTDLPRQRQVGTVSTGAEPAGTSPPSSNSQRDRTTHIRRSATARVMFRPCWSNIN